MNTRAKTGEKQKIGRPVLYNKSKPTAGSHESGSTAIIGTRHAAATPLINVKSSYKRPKRLAIQKVIIRLPIVVTREPSILPEKG